AVLVTELFGELAADRLVELHFQPRRHARLRLPRRRFFSLISLVGLRGLGGLVAFLGFFGPLALVRLVAALGLVGLARLAAVGRTLRAPVLLRRLFRPLGPFLVGISHRSQLPNAWRSELSCG